MIRYAVVYEWAETNWCAYIPDVPGLAVTGRTLEETRERLGPALRMHLEGLAEDGLSAPEAVSFAEMAEVEAPMVAR
jgi:predicted RNase H-like HicB family nuclease